MGERSLKYAYHVQAISLPVFEVVKVGEGFFDGLREGDCAVGVGAGPAF